MPEPRVKSPILPAVVLAAGRGTRMPGDLPKVLHRVAGRPMLLPVIEACHAVPCRPVIVVVGHRQEMVREALNGVGDVVFAVQREQRGTADAVEAAGDLLRQLSLGASGQWPGQAQDVVIVCGDGPLVRADTLRAVIHHHRRTAAACTLATATLEDPAGYGRIVRDAHGRFAGIVEERHATPQQRAIREVNPSYYCFRIADLLTALAEVAPEPISGERYLTAVPALLAARGRQVELVPGIPADEVLSVNTPQDLERVDRVLRGRAGGAAFPCRPAAGGSP